MIKPKQVELDQISYGIAKVDDKEFYECTVTFALKYEREIDQAKVSATVRIPAKDYTESEMKEAFKNEAIYALTSAVSAADPQVEFPGDGQFQRQ